MCLQLRELCCVAILQEFVFQQPCDWITNTNKLKRAGFNEMKLVRYPFDT